MTGRTEPANKKKEVHLATPMGCKGHALHVSEKNSGKMNIYTDKKLFLTAGSLAGGWKTAQKAATTFIALSKLNQHNLRTGDTLLLIQ